ncbi:MAG TPA: adenylate/guanylate cyclase domain-containing protein [Longimicrobiales bacterium]|nr:adenylate/guanylate cyclase domain-containing protein [Longimicrobiales bacterium]
MRTYHYAWEWQLDAAPDALWPLVADTDRFNRDAAVPPVDSTDGDFCTTGYGRRNLELSRFGVRIAWEEQAFEWVRPRSFSVVRNYYTGPVQHMAVRVALEPHGGGTRVRYSVAAVARNLLGRLAIPAQIGVLSRRQFAAVFRDYATHAQRAAAGSALPAMPLHTAAHVTSAAAARLDAVGERMRAQPRIAQRWQLLRAVIERAADADVDRLRPYELADAWHAPRRDVLRLCLEATRAGALQLRWDLLCPLCRGSKDSAHTLGELALHAYCTCCHVDVDADFDRAVELSFRPVPAIRALDVAPHCVGGPQLTPHIAVQQLLQPRAQRTVHVALERGRYRVRAADVPGMRFINAGQGSAAAASLTLTAAGWSSADADVASDARLDLHNDTDVPQLFIIERVAWSDRAVVAADVFALQEFRDLFAAEALRPGERVSIGATTILFTDLRASTALYDRIGDAPAFGQVLDHFTALRQALEQEEGAIVKTIGDAVMAVFHRPVGAVRAILRAHELLAASMDGIQPVQLKAGAHYGSCIAVTLNDRLDYFGATVNIAARLGAAAEGGDVVISDDIYRDPEVAQLVQALQLDVVTEEVLLKGCSRPVRCHRLRTARVHWSRC